MDGFYITFLPYLRPLLYHQFKDKDGGFATEANLRTAGKQDYFRKSAVSFPRVLDVFLLKAIQALLLWAFQKHGMQVLSDISGPFIYPSLQCKYTESPKARAGLGSDVTGSNLPLEL